MGPLCGLRLGQKCLPDPQQQQQHPHLDWLESLMYSCTPSFNFGAFLLQMLGIWSAICEYTRVKNRRTHAPYAASVSFAATKWKSIANWRTANSTSCRENKQSSNGSKMIWSKWATNYELSRSANAMTWFARRRSDSCWPAILKVSGRKSLSNWAYLYPCHCPFLCLRFQATYLLAYLVFNENVPCLVFFLS